MISANINRQTRRNVYRRDGFRCVLCDDARRLQIHHIVPRGQGGPGENEMNLVTLCPRCHALIHGVDVDGLARAFGEQFSPDYLTQVVTEYVSDLYAERVCTPWNPWSPASFDWRREGY